MRHEWLKALSRIALAMSAFFALGGVLQAEAPRLSKSQSPSQREQVSLRFEPLAETKYQILLCQHGEPVPATVSAPVMQGVQCNEGCNLGGEAKWNAWRPIPWQAFAQGEYVGPHRTAHVDEYRLRVDDQLQFVYRLTREESSTPYELNVGDSIRVEAFADPGLDREVVIQPDGSITLRLVGQVHAADRTIEELREHLEKAYTKFYKVPAITVTPVKVNTRLEDLRASVDARYGQGGQTRDARITPEGTVQLPGIGSVPAQGLTLDELKREIDERYAQFVGGIEVTPVLTQRAPRYIYVLGEVKTPGRFTLEGPTTVMQSIALAGGWNNGGNLREIVVFRRDDNWQLMATRLDMRGALLGKRPCPADEIWLRDSDVIVVPKSSILLADDFIELVFTRGIYGVIPFSASYNYSRASLLP
jgi:polysaccharide export outer membrane protein